MAEAEAAAHGVDVGEVHFHEVGAADSIADILAAAALLDSLDFDRVYATPLSEGSGTVMCQHGTLPVPVPAVLNIAMAYGIPLSITDNRSEMVTPTGIAILAALSPDFKARPKSFAVKKTGMGLGKRDFGRANFLRAMLIEENEVTDGSEPSKPDSESRLYMVETSIDDSTAQELSYAQEKLFQIGAKDVYFCPCYMKKNRPGYTIGAIVEKSLLTKAAEVLFSATTTIGLRYYPINRIEMDRRGIGVDVRGENVDVKVSCYGEIVRCHPEYQSVKVAAERTGRSFREIYAEAQVLALDLVRKRK